MKTLSKHLATGALAVAGTVATLGLGSVAQAATFNSPTINLSSQDTPFLTPGVDLNFSKFDSTNRTITAVRVFLSATLTGDVTFINPNDGISRDVRQYTQNGNLRARGPGGTPTLVQVFPTQNVIVPSSPVTLAPGTSSVNNFNTSAGPTSAVVANANWSLFVANGGGIGTVNFGGTASALSDIDNGIDVITNADIGGSFRFEVDYTDNPVQGTPEPGTILGILTVAGIGALSRRKG